MGRRKIDEVDRVIIDKLRENAKVSFSNIARELNVTPVTVMNRVRKLTKSGVIRSFTVDVDWKKIGYNVAVMIEISVRGKSHKDMEDVKRILREHPNIDAIYDVTGESDIVAIGRFRDHNELTSFVVNNLLTHGNVKSTETRFIF